MEAAEQAFHKRSAATCNDAAWDLIEQQHLEPLQLAQLVETAATARHHWRQVGTESQIAHADLLFCWALARAGAAGAAKDAAGRALSYFGENGAPWEQAFAHAAMAETAQALGDQSNHRFHYETASRIAQDLPDETRNLFEAAFSTIRAPAP